MASQARARNTGNCVDLVTSKVRTVLAQSGAPISASTASNAERSVVRQASMRLPCGVLGATLGGMVRRSSVRAEADAPTINR